MITQILNVNRKVKVYNPTNPTLKRLVTCKLQITSIKRNFVHVSSEFKPELLQELKRLRTALPKLQSYIDFRELDTNDKIIFNQFKI